jgi:hypothetical protein
MLKNDVDTEWSNFLLTAMAEDDGNDSSSEDDLSFVGPPSSSQLIFDGDTCPETPKATPIYISTKTKLAYLTQPIELKETFWNVPVMSYCIAENGVIKKQMKFNSLEPEELQSIVAKLANEPHYDEHIITHIDNPFGRVKFKDIRKISIGICKKDLMSYRCKQKSAFYNCFVLIFRVKIQDNFKDFHVKIFNTGKIEIPGIQSEETFQVILNMVLTTLRPYYGEELNYKPNNIETVLINSNFNCGFYINREVLYDTLRFKYNIQAIYDPCSYPGIQCKFYFNPEVEHQSGSQISEANRSIYKDITEVSFMIFRTGSVLIVGRCDEKVLFYIYEFLKIILNNEFRHICQKNVKMNGEVDQNSFQCQDKIKPPKKIRRKCVTIVTDCVL